MYMFIVERASYHPDRCTHNPGYSGGPAISNGKVGLEVVIATRITGGSPEIFGLLLGSY